MSKPQAKDSKLGVRFILKNLLIALFIVVLVIDTVPSTFGLHSRLKEWIEPVLDKTGLWQGTWGLFAPNPAISNNAVSADIKYHDGAIITWTSADPATGSYWEKFRMFRWNEYYDTIRLDDYEDGWPGLADWLASQFQDDRNPVVRVRLYRSWTYLSEDTLKEKDPFPFSKRRMIFRKEYSGE